MPFQRPTNIIYTLLTALAGLAVTGALTVSGLATFSDRLYINSASTDNIIQARSTTSGRSVFEVSATGSKVTGDFTVTGTCTGCGGSASAFAENTYFVNVATSSGQTYSVRNPGVSYSDSSASFRTVWTNLFANNAGAPVSIVFGRGTFSATDVIEISQSNISMRGQGPGVTNLQATTGMGDSAFFKVDPAQSASGDALTVDANVGDLAVTMSVGNCAHYVAGDFVVLYSSLSIDSENSSRNQGELHRVISTTCASGIVTFGVTNNGTHVYQTMTVANTAKVAKLNFYSNISVSGIKFTDAATSRTNSLITGQVLMRFVNNLSITNCEFANLYNSGLMTWQTWNTRVEGNTFRDIVDVTPAANTFYGIVVRGASLNTTIVGNTFDNMRHSVTQGAGTTAYYAGTTRNLVISGNASTNSPIGHFDVHQGAEGVTISNNTMVGDDSSANGIQVRSPATITGNSIIGVKGKGISLFGGASGSTISGNDIKGATDGVFVDVMVNRVNITGNTMRGGTRGITLSRFTNTVTTPIASPGLVTLAAHTLTPGSKVSFSGGTLPTGITAGVQYWVIQAGMTTGVFEIAATEGGAAINFTGTSSGTQTMSEIGGNESVITGNQVIDNSAEGVSANGQKSVKVTGNYFRNNTRPIILSDSDTQASGWQFTDNFSGSNTTSNIPSLAGTGHYFSDQGYIRSDSTSNIFQIGTMIDDKRFLTTSSTATMIGNAFHLTGLVETTNTTITVSSTNTLLLMRGTVARTVTLPACAAADVGRLLFIDDSGQTGATNNLTIARAGSDTIDGATSKVISTNGGSAQLVCSAATRWFSL